MAAQAAKSALGLIYHQTRKNLMIGEHTKLIIQVLYLRSKCNFAIKLIDPDILPISIESERPTEVRVWTVWGPLTAV